VAVLEGQIAIAYRSTANISVQNLIDCADNPKWWVCRLSSPCQSILTSTYHLSLGGDGAEGMKYINKHGITSEKRYPYLMANGTCRNETVYATAEVCEHV
jgi:hypothetical protein